VYTHITVSVLLPPPSSPPPIPPPSPLISQEYTSPRLYAAKKPEDVGLGGGGNSGSGSGSGNGSTTETEDEEGLDRKDRKKVKGLLHISFNFRVDISFSVLYRIHFI
jgi:hypothetical protein